MQSKTLNVLLESFVERLQIIYDEREASNMAKWSLMHIFGIKSSADFAVLRNVEVSAEQLEAAVFWLRELAKGKPIQHLIGKVSFYGLSIQVNNHVLVPRPETEELVHLIVEYFPSDFSGHILDIGTGSGCIALALKSQFMYAQVKATDISSMALEVANKNAQTNKLVVDFVKENILESQCKPASKFNIIVSNPPYIPLSEKASLAKNVLEYEPHIALFAPTENPLIFYEAILNYAQKFLIKSGFLFFELHENFAQETLNLAFTYFENAQLKQDFQGKERFLVIVNN